MTSGKIIVSLSREFRQASSRIEGFSLKKGRDEQKGVNEASIMAKTVSFLYQLARMANDIEKLSSGDPKRIVRRAKNKYIGRKLIRKAWKFPF